MSKPSNNFERIAAAGTGPRNVGTTASTPQDTTRMSIDVTTDMRAGLHAYVGRAGAELSRRITTNTVVCELIGELHDSPELAARVIERLREQQR